MKKLMMVLVLVAVLAGCGDNQVAPLEFESAYYVSVTADAASSQLEILTSCGAQDDGLKAGTGIFDQSGDYVDPVLRVIATPSEIDCYKKTGAYSMIQLGYLNP